MILFFLLPRLLFTMVKYFSAITKGDDVFWCLISLSRPLRDRKTGANLSMQRCRNHLGWGEGRQGWPVLAPWGPWSSRKHINIKKNPGDDHKMEHFRLCFVKVIFFSLSVRFFLCAVSMVRFSITFLHLRLIFTSHKIAHPRLLNYRFEVLFWISFFFLIVFFIIIIIHFLPFFIFLLGAGQPMVSSRTNSSFSPPSCQVEGGLRWT